ncbi:hypothetical protein BN946_scf184842.g6 [Trametes cinnabarina]|uniref:Uncharacterized protein n=1 Tax=Pycnoporus cinnabarinus TaxID=5643 RepID=A0A060S781_PYCCI|nr:hypothetical protein BN946_scf184842.g6 [Trametes cinnabarina]
MKQLLGRDDFDPADIARTDFKRLDGQLAAGICHDAPWSDEREGWRTASVTIGVPTNRRATQASRREATASARRVTRHEPAADTPAAHAIPGYHFTVPGFHHKSICAEIKKTFSSDPAARDFVYDPYLVERQLPDTTETERVYGELYNSPSFVQEDIRLQNSPREPGCDLPRAIAAIMLWSDATVVSQFGNQKAWPAYMYFGNQSKYARARPTARAAHHIAYFTVVSVFGVTQINGMLIYLPRQLPDEVQDFVRAQTGGKSASAPLLTHCRRELFHAQWECLLDEEFLHAYEHGIVIDCMDGVRRRIYPRIFTYSADYLEKMLIATLRDKGRCPCPHCLINFDAIENMGTSDDSENRSRNIRGTVAEQDARVQEARNIIYNEGYVVNSDHVENLLREQSLVPTRNAFSRLERFGFNIRDALVVDQLHEFELGVWKALFSHLVRILETVGTDVVNELNQRFRQVPTFAWTTIRKFADNVCDMKRLAARDFEDILQCIIPCFEGLLPEAHNNTILTLLFISAYWHALAKMRMHTDTSVKLLHDTMAVLGYELRHFAAVTCAAFPDTRETVAEYDTRKRAEARRTARGPPAVHSGGDPVPFNGRRLRHFNLKTVKLHFLGYYAPTVKKSGTTDSYTTQTGEHEHRRMKSRWERTNHVNAEGQVVNIDARESRMHSMAHELAEHGLDIPGIASPLSGDPDASPVPIPPEMHHHIGDTEKNHIELRDWQTDHPVDAVLDDFVYELKEHLRERLRELFPSLDDPDIPVILRHDRIYRHATAHVNYTTYDLQRDQDILHPAVGKCDIMIHTPGVHLVDESELYPWTYARVLGIYHAIVLPPGETCPQRVEFLHVRWLEHDCTWTSGPDIRRMERIRFVPWTPTSSGAFGFVDPSHILRSCHLIPAFHYGRTSEYLPPQSCYQEAGGEWKYFYVNRFADRDIFVRYLGCGPGHLEARARSVERIVPDGFNPNVLVNMDHVPGWADEAEDGDQLEGEDGDVPERPDDEDRRRRSLPFPSQYPLSASIHSSNFFAMAIGTARTHSERDSSGSEDEHAPTSKRPLTRKARTPREAALIAAGSAVGLMGDLFRDFQSILDAGIHLNDHSPSTALTYRERKYQELFRYIQGIVLWVVEEITQRGPKGTLLVARDLEIGRMAVRSADIHGIKKAILTWNQYVPVIQPDAKSTRGFNHPECGRLLCPVTYDWSDPELRRALQNGSRRYPTGGRDWPVVLWKDERVDSDNLSVGFLRNRRLVMAGRHSLLGPRAAQQAIPGKLPARKPKAKIHRIRSITVGFIAYTAVLVHLSLNSQESFGDGATAGTFPYEEFYQSLVRYVEDTMTSDESGDLLTWWTSEIFGQLEDDYATEDEGTSGRPLSVMARMRAQAAARVAATEAAEALNSLSAASSPSAPASAQAAGV